MLLEPDLRAVADRFHIRELVNAPLSLLRARLFLMHRQSATLDLSSIRMLGPCETWLAGMSRMIHEAAAFGFSEIIMPMTSLGRSRNGPNELGHCIQDTMDTFMPLIKSVDFAACGEKHTETQFICHALHYLPNISTIKLPTCCLSLAQSCSLRSSLRKVSSSLQSLTITQLPHTAINATRVCSAIDVCTGITCLELQGLSLDANHEHLASLKGLFEHLLTLTGLQSLRFPVLPQDPEQSSPVLDVRHTLQPLSGLTALTTLEIMYHKPSTEQNTASLDLGGFLVVLAEVLSPLESLKVLRMTFPWKQYRYGTTLEFIRDTISAPACTMCMGDKQKEKPALLGIQVTSSTELDKIFRYTNTTDEELFLEQLDQFKQFTLRLEDLGLPDSDSILLFPYAQALHSIPSLRTLHLYSRDIPNKYTDPHKVAQLKNLSSLTLLSLQLSGGFAEVCEDTLASAVEALEHLRKVSITYADTTEQTSPRSPQLLPTIAAKTALEALELHGFVRVHDPGWLALLGRSASSSSGLSSMLHDYNNSRSCSGQGFAAVVATAQTGNSSKSLPGCDPFPSFQGQAESSIGMLEGGENVPMPTSLTRLALSGVHEKDMSAVCMVLMQLRNLQELCIGRCSPVWGLDCSFVNVMHDLKLLQMDVVQDSEGIQEFGGAISKLTKLTGLHLGFSSLPTKAVQQFSDCLSSLVELKEFKPRISYRSVDGVEYAALPSSSNRLKPLWDKVAGSKIPVQRWQKY